jgi:hypothetical protein
VARRLVEVDLAETKLATDLPTEVHQQIRSPWPKRHYVELIHAMTWRLLIAPRSDYFVTRDNAEISLPLAPDVALHACRQGRPEELHFVDGQAAKIDPDLPGVVDRVAEGRAWAAGLEGQPGLCPLFRRPTAPEGGLHA